MRDPWVLLLLMGMAYLLLWCLIGIAMAVVMHRESKSRRGED